MLFEWISFMYHLNLFISFINFYLNCLTWFRVQNLSFLFYFIFAKWLKLIFSYIKIIQILVTQAKISLFRVIWWFPMTFKSTLLSHIPSTIPITSSIRWLTILPNWNTINTKWICYVLILHTMISTSGLTPKEDKVVEYVSSIGYINCFCTRWFEKWILYL